MSSGENRLSDVELADLAAAAAAGVSELVTNPLACPKILLLPVAAGTLPPKPLANAPPPPPVCAEEEKLNPEAEPNPEVAADELEVGAVKEKEAGETAEEVAEEPNPDGGCVGTTGALPKPVEDDGAAEEPNPPPAEVKLKVLAWTGAAVPNPTGLESTQEKRFEYLIRKVRQKKLNIYMHRKFLILSIH